MSINEPTTGADLIGWGHMPGRWFKDALAEAASLRAGGADEGAIRAVVAALAPPAPVEIDLRTNAPPFGIFLAATDAEQANRVEVIRHMDALLRTPTLAP